MLSTIIRKEILEAILSFRFVVATLLCLLLVPLGIFVNLKDYERRLSEYRDAERLYEQRAKGRLGSDFHAEGYRPPSALSIFSVGLEYFMPNKVTTSRDGHVGMENDQGVSNPQSFLFGKIDLLFNVSFVISLLALIFSFNAVTGEKEDGTLRLLIAGSLPRWRILVGKIIGNYLVLLLPFFLSILLSLIILNTSIPVFSPQMFWPFITVLAVTLLFLFAMFLLGILVSTLTQRSITSIVVLLFIWAVLVLTLPKISPMLAEIIYPVNSPMVVRLQEDLARQNLEKEYDLRKRELYDRVLAQYGFTGRGISVPGRTDAERKAQEAYDDQKKPLDEEASKRISEETRKLREEYKNMRATQASIAMNLSRLSPVSCYTYIISELSSTGVLEMDNFVANAERYQDEVKQNLYDNFLIDSYGGTNGGTAVMIHEKPGFEPGKAAVPQLSYHRIGYLDGLRAEGPDVVLLVLFTIVFFAAGWAAFSRYDVR